MFSKTTIQPEDRKIKCAKESVPYPAVMLVSARLRHVAGTKWGTRRYLDMSHLTEAHRSLLDLDALDQAMKTEAG